MAVAGDVSAPGLALSGDDAALLAARVSVVFHCAANVRFDLSIKEAVSLNTVGTRNVLLYSKTIENLDVSDIDIKCTWLSTTAAVWPSHCKPERVASSRVSDAGIHPRLHRVLPLRRGGPGGADLHDRREPGEGHRHDPVGGSHRAQGNNAQVSDPVGLV